MEVYNFCTCCGRKISEIKADLDRQPWIDNVRKLGVHKQIRHPIPNSGDWVIYFYEGVHLNFCSCCGKKLEDREIAMSWGSFYNPPELKSYKCSKCGNFEEF